MSGRKLASETRTRNLSNKRGRLLTLLIVEVAEEAPRYGADRRALRWPALHAVVSGGCGGVYTRACSSKHTPSFTRVASLQRAQGIYMNLGTLHQGPALHGGPELLRKAPLPLGCAR